MRQVFIFTWPRMTCVACQRRSRPTCTGRRARRPAGRLGGAAGLRYVPCIYVPDEQRCLCLFEAAGPDLVRNVNDIAQFPLAHVTAVVCTASEGGSPLADLEQDRPDDRY